MANNAGGIGGVGGAGAIDGELPPGTKIGKDAGKRKFELLGKNQPEKSGGCDVKGGFWWAGVALAVASLVVGASGLLVYLNLLQVTLTGVGTMSTALGLYTVLGGVGLAFVLTVVLSVTSCLSKPKTDDPKADKSSWWSCLTCSGSKDDGAVGKKALKA